MRLLPPSSIPPQVLSIVVDLGPRSSGGGAREASMLATVDRLLQLCHDFDFPATWAMDELAGHDLVQRIVQNGAGHEVAIRADDAWAGAGTGRGAFSHGLSRRVQQAEAAGLEITSICAEGPVCREHLDLLIKYGVDFVALSAGDVPVQGNLRTLRYGLWEIGPSIRLPEADTRWRPFGGPGRRTRATIDQAVSGQTLCMAIVRAAEMTESGHFLNFEKLLRHAHRRNRQGVLSLRTLGAISEQFRGHATPRPASSILRAA